MSENPDAAPLSFYEEIGGHETFVRLVAAFYRGVAADDGAAADVPRRGSRSG